jgi:hypothetical protein
MNTETPTGPPSIAEIAALTSRLRHLRSPEASEEERARFLADKEALLERLPRDPHERNES